MSQQTARLGGAGVVLSLVAASTFGTSGSFATALTDAGWSPGAAVTARVGIAAVVLLIPAWIQLHRQWPAMKVGRRGDLLRSARTVVLFGLLSVAACQLCFFYAVQRLSVGVALLLEYLGIVLVVLWQWLGHGERPHPLTLVGSAGALVGLVLVLDLTSSQHLDPIGVLWGLGAAVGLASFFLLSARTEEPLPPLAMAAAGMTVGALALLVCGLVGVLPLHATYGSVHFGDHTTSWIVPVLGLSLLAATLSYVAGIGAVRHLGARLASFLGLTEVLFAVLWAWLLLGQLPGRMQLLGGVFIIAGVALVRIDELRRPAVAASSPAVDAGPSERPTTPAFEATAG